MDNIEIIFPVSARHIGPADGAAVEYVNLRDALSEGFNRHLLPGNLLVDRVLALAVVQGQVTGVFQPLKATGEKLLGTLVRTYLYRNDVGELLIENERKKIVAAIHWAEQHLDSDIYDRVPSWNDAPVIAWLSRYASRALFPRGLFTAHSNLMKKVHSGLDSGKASFSLVTTVRNFASAFLLYSRIASDEVVKELGANPSNLLLTDFLLGLLRQNPPPDRRRTGQSLLTYESRIRAILSTEKPREWAPRQSFSRTPVCSDQGVVKFAPRVDDASDEYDEFSPRHPARTEVVEQIEQYEDEILSGLFPFSEQDETDAQKAAQSTKKRRRNSFFIDPWPGTIHANPTIYTPGVLKFAEIALLLRAMFNLKISGDAERADTAIFVLLAGIFCGWTTQLWRAPMLPRPLAAGDCPDLIFLSGGSKVFITPRVSVGCPVSLQPAKLSPKQYAENVTEHRRHFEPVSPSYYFALHPALQHVLNPITSRKKSGEILLTEDDYGVALDDLSAELKILCPTACNIRGGRLSASFQGYANSLGFDPVDRYVVCTKPMASHEMPINYTRVGVASACREHWKFVDTILEKVHAASARVSGLLGADCDQEWCAPSEEFPANRFRGVMGYTGSWSVPKISRVRALLAFLDEQAKRNDLPLFEIENWKTRLVTLEMVLVMLLRPFEVNSLPLPAGWKRRGADFAHSIKQKYWKDQPACALRHLPQLMRNRFWDCIEQCAVGYATGDPIFCIRGPAGERLPFDLQAEIDYTLSCMGHKVWFIRDYGLRHLGRTLHKEAGMAFDLLAWKMTHEGQGCEFHNPLLSLDIRHFHQIDDEITEVVARELGIGAV